MSSDNEPISLAGPEDTRQALLALLESTRRSLRLYTPHMDARLYNDAQVVDALRNRLVNQPRLRVQLLLPEAKHWRSACPLLLTLADRLRSSIETRTPPRDEPRESPELTQGVMIADESALIHLLDPRRLIGSYTPQGSPATRELSNFFQEIWEKSTPDPDLRYLRL